MGTDGIVYSSDTSLIKLNASSMNPQAEGIKKLIQSQIIHSGKVVGYIGFYSLNPNTAWSATQLTTFKALFKIISEAVASKQSQRNRF